MLERRRLALALLILFAAGNARAERMIRPGGFFREVTSRVGSNHQSAQTARDEPPASLPKLGGTSPPKRRSNFRSTLGVLFVTRDLEIPGTKNLGFRMIPTRKALGGETQIPFVLRAKVGASRLGLEVGGRF